MSSRSSAEEHGKWRDHSECKCSKSDKKAYNICLIEVSISNFFTRVLADLATLTLGDPLVHLAVQCEYRCSRCDQTEYYTFEFSKVGKEARCGAYDRAYTVESCKHEMSLKKLKQIWSDTWPNTTADDYDTLERNCLSNSIVVDNETKYFRLIQITISMKHIKRFFSLFIGVIYLIHINQSLGNTIKQETRLKRIRRIIRGHLAKPGQLPYQVSINNNGDHFCGGALIHEKWVLSAAHCLKYFTSIQNFYAVMGAIYLDQTDTKHVQISRIAAYFPFPRYDPWGDPSNGNVTRNDHDLVLLKLQTRARFSTRVRPIRLPNRTSNQISSEQMQQCIVSGFGTIKDSRQSHILKYLTVPIVEREQCARGHRPKRIKDFHICAGYWHGGSDACNGDSGGPLACYINDKPVLIGIVSWGVECARHGTYGVYTRVSRYIRWINQTIERNS
ncbi:unnamed protein product [Adineta ricciae]|uniref:Peptidase S1 domain-containing protein n=1 Tax=Adineta ricciae TaxID=249248 RepID=A0A814FBX5_ADIRI|nr:unnamed protein product [Adineta ricciae]